MRLMEQQKIRSFLTGFLGWFIAGNVVMWVFFLLPTGKWLDLIRIFGYGVVTVIIASVLFSQKRHWYALGIVSAIILNAIAWQIYLLPKPIFVIGEVFAVPLPIGLYNLMRIAFPGNA